MHSSPATVGVLSNSAEFRASPLTRHNRRLWVQLGGQLYRAASQTQCFYRVVAPKPYKNHVFGPPPASGDQGGTQIVP